MKITPKITLSVTITSYIPADPGRTSGPVDYCYPPEPPELEFTLLTPGGTTLGEEDFSPEAWDTITQEVISKYETQIESDADEARIAAYLDYTEGF